MKQLAGHHQEVLAVDAQGSDLVSGSCDRTARLWDVRTCKTTNCVARLPGDVNSVKRHLNKVYMACESKVYCFDVRKLALISSPADAEFVLEFNTDEVNQIDVDVKHRYLAASDDSGEVKIVDLFSQQVYRTLRKHTNICMSAVFRPGKPQLLSGGMDYSVFLWDFGRARVLSEISTPACLAQQVQSQSQPLVNPPMVHRVAFSSDGSTFAAALGDGSVLLSTCRGNAMHTPVAVLETGASVVTDVLFPDSDPSHLLALASDGVLTLASLTRDDTAAPHNNTSRQRQWVSPVSTCSTTRTWRLPHKPNAMCAVDEDGGRVVVAGVGKRMALLDWRVS